MRKLFVTLAEESANVLAMTPFAEKLINYYRKRIHRSINHTKNAKQVLIQLGFSDEAVNRALILKANNPKAALDWLFANETSTGLKKSRTSSFARSSILSSTYETARTVDQRVDDLLEIVDFYANKDELVLQEYIDSMVFMGYEEEHAREALRSTRNNVSSAVALIHGDKNQSITELRHGLSATSEMKKKFLVIFDTTIFQRP